MAGGTGDRVGQPPRQLYVFGLGFAALLAGEALLAAPDWRRRFEAMRGWPLFGGLSVAAALVTPYGIDGLLLPLRLTRMNYALSQLVEWQSPNFQYFQPLELWIAIVFITAFSRGWRLPLTRIGIFLLLLHMALQHGRNGELLGFVAPLLLAPALAPQLVASPSRRTLSALDRTMAALAKPASSHGMAIAVTVLVAVSAVALRRGIARESDAITPAAALATVRAQPIGGPVFNSYSFGGYLIFSGIEPFIDGRAELYGDAFIKRYVEGTLLTSDQLPQLLADYGITWTLLSPTTPSVALLDHLPGWRRLYTDDVAVVHVREDQAAR